MACHAFFRYLFWLFPISAKHTTMMMEPIATGRIATPAIEGSGGPSLTAITPPMKPTMVPATMPPGMRFGTTQLTINANIAEVIKYTKNPTTVITLYLSPKRITRLGRKRNWR